MQALRWESRPDLKEPVIISAFHGWNDGGLAATAALQFLIAEWKARRFASIDMEDFLDFQVHRPTVRLVSGVSRVLEWPPSHFHHASPGRDLVLYLGVEPNFRWRTFVQEFLGLARELGVSALVTLGGYLADVPHTRPVPITGSAPSPEEAARLAMEPSRYEGPTGIVGVLHHEAASTGIPSYTLWAAVPHYLRGGANPKAALALVRRVARFLGVPVDTRPLEEAVATWEAQVRAAVEADPDLRAYVERLEASVPSGEEIAEEIERFLREQGGQS